MSGNTLGFLSGFGQSFGDAFYKKKMQQHQDELANNRMQFQVLSNAFQSAAEQGDNESAATTLEMMGPLITGGKEKKGQPNLFKEFANKIREGKTVESQQPTEEASQAQGNINQAIQSNASPETLQTFERPRIATETKSFTKPYFTSPIEREVQKQKALIPIKAEVEANEQKLLGERQEKLARINADERRKLNTEKEAALISRDENKLARAYESTINQQTGLRYTPEEALSTARNLITQKKESDVANVNSRIEYRRKQFEETHNKNEELYKHWSQIENYLANKTSQGERMLNQNDLRIQQQYGEAKNIKTEIESNEEQMRGIINQENQLRASQQFADSSKQLEIQNQINELERQYDLRQNKLYQLQNNLYNLPKPNVLIPTQQNNQNIQPKRNLTKNNDPLGIR